MMARAPNAVASIERAIDLRARRVQRLPEDQSGQPGVDEDRPVAVVPVERDEARLPGRERRRLREARACSELVALAHALHPPLEDVADGGLPGFDAEDIPA